MRTTARREEETGELVITVRIQFTELNQPMGALERELGRRTAPWLEAMKQILHRRRGGPPMTVHRGIDRHTSTTAEPELEQLLTG